MSSYHSHYDDAEKHLIGNLLCDQDDSFQFHSSGSSQSSTRDHSASVSSTNVVSAVSGGELAPSWPEPPPPYTPPSSLFLPPPPGLPVSTWGEAPPVPRNENAVDDWSSYLSRYNGPSYRPVNELRSSAPTAPVSAPVQHENVMPFSYRDAVNRGVSARSLASSRHGSASSMPKEEEKSDGRRRKGSSEETSRGSGQSGGKGGGGEKSEENFQQITRKKGPVKMGQSDGKSKQTKSRAILVSELMDTPTIEEDSRFTILEKLPSRRNTSSFSEDDGSFGSMEKTPTQHSLTRQERKNGGGSGMGGGGGMKKRWRREERREKMGVEYHAEIVIGWIKIVMAYLSTYVIAASYYLYDLGLDFGTYLVAVGRFGLEHLSIACRCKLHEYRGRVAEWWNGRDKGDETFGLMVNVRLPETADEALERLLNARGQDAYSVLGVRADESDEVIKMFYKKQALLVHPDKNEMDGAAEAFQILSKANELISTPEKRKKYNSERMMTNPLQKELAELYRVLKEKVEETRNRMDCDCGKTHQRVASDLPQQAARYCRKCDCRHAAKNCDIWAESRFFGFYWVYYTCTNGVVYDITSWANCSVNQLKHLRVDQHSVQYRMMSTPPSRENRQTQEKYLRMLSEGLERATSMHVGTSQASLQPIDREEDRPRKAKRATKKK